MVVEPRILLLDEPLSNLDANLRVEMRQELLQLQRHLGITTIFVTHDQEEANTICDRIAVMASGVIQQVGEPVDVYDHPVNKFVAEFLGTANVIPGYSENTSEGTVFVADKGLRLHLPGEPEKKRGYVVIRPQGIGILDAPGKDNISGTVAAFEFLGSNIRYVVKVGAIDVTIDEKHVRGVARYSMGQTLNLSFPDDQTTFITAE